MSSHATAAVAAALGLMAAGPAFAACSLSAQPITVNMKTQRPMVEVKVNGKAGRFVVDSSTAVNQISAKFANAAKLAVPASSAAGPPVVKADTFEFAGATLKNASFLVTDKAPDADGVIGQTILHTGDVEYDLAGGPGGAPSVKLFKAEGCEGVNMAYWAKEGDLFWEAALTPDKDTPFTRLEVIVNGIKLRGVVSSAKSYTSITEKAAAQAGLKPGGPGVKPMGPSSWVGRFGSVIVGNEETKDADLEIDRTSDDFYDVLIGADFLSAHHVYVANSQQKIYFTRAGFPGAKIFRAQPPRVTALQSQGHLQDHFSPGNDN